MSIEELADLTKEFIGFKRKIVWDASKPDGQPIGCLYTSEAFK